VVQLKFTYIEMYALCIKLIHIHIRDSVWLWDFSHGWNWGGISSSHYIWLDFALPIYRKSSFVAYLARPLIMASQQWGFTSSFLHISFIWLSRIDSFKGSEPRTRAKGIFDEIILLANRLRQNWLFTIDLSNKFVFLFFYHTHIGYTEKINPKALCMYLL